LSYDNSPENFGFSLGGDGSFLGGADSFLVSSCFFIGSSTGLGLGLDSAFGEGFAATAHKKGNDRKGANERNM